MAKIRYYDQHTDTYSGEALPPPEKLLHSYTDGGSVTISKRWFPVGYPVAGGEKEILTACYKHLRELQYPVLRVEAGGVLRRTGPDTALMQGSRTVGWPDLIACELSSGRMIGVELKQVGKRVDIAQLGVLHDLRIAGALVAICCSLQGLRNLLGRRPPVHVLDKLPIY